MKETIREFINRVGVPENFTVRVEANDMIPKMGNPESIIKQVGDLYVSKSDFTEINNNSIIIIASYYGC